MASRVPLVNHGWMLKNVLEGVRGFQSLQYYFWCVLSVKEWPCTAFVYSIVFLRLCIACFVAIYWHVGGSTAALHQGYPTLLSHFECIRRLFL